MSDGYVKVMVSTMIWGTAGIFARWSGADPLELAFYRCSAAVVAFMFLFAHGGEKIPLLRGKQMLLCILSGLFQAAGMVFYFAAISASTLSRALFLYYMGPVFLVVLAPLLLKEKLENKSLLALLISLMGMALIIYSSSTGLRVAEMRGAYFALLGALFFSLTIATTRFIKAAGGAVITFYQVLTAALCILPLAGFKSAPGIKELAAVTVLGFFHTAFAYSIYYEGLREIKMQHAGVLLYLDPVIASLLGYLVFKEAMGPQGYWGGMLIALGGIIVVCSYSESLPGRDRVF